MPEVTVTFEAGAQTEVVVIPDATVARAVDMVENTYSHPDPDATLLQRFAWGLRTHFLTDLFLWERRANAVRRSTWDEPPVAGGTEAGGGGKE
jgi:hypothetical protein